ncbi:MAG: hypothetical protein V4642_10925 [Bacteroidota bacterium]
MRVQSFLAFFLVVIIAAGCTDKANPVSILPVTIDSTAAPAGKLVFVRAGKRFESDDYFKDTSGIYHGAYAFYQVSTNELSIYGRKEGSASEVIHLTTKVPTQQEAPFNVSNYTIEYQDGIILKSKAFQTDAQHFGKYRMSKFDLGAGLVSGTFESVLIQTFPIDKKDSTEIKHGSFTDLHMIIMD